VAERTADLQQKNAELERFTYTVSHDLKSPLITIKGFSGSIKRDLTSGRHDRLEQDLERIEMAADKMTVLLADLLDLSRIGRIINAPEPVAMNGLVSEVLAQLAGSMGGGNVEVVVQPGLPTVPCDRLRMAEVVQNLLENAVKSMGDQPEPRILFGMRKAHGESVFFVQDNGMGIDPKHHEEIFGLFNKLDATTEGTGIGLALVKRIIEVHGGRVWVASEGAGRGRTFCFTLPCLGDNRQGTL
jgi:signal transduction histidine kinase